MSHSFFLTYRRDLLVLLMLSFVLVCGLFGQNSFLRGDTQSYITSIEVLRSDNLPVGFTPNRLISNFLFLESIRVVSFFVGDTLLAWIMLNSLGFLVAGFALFRILTHLVQDDYAAFAGTFLFAVNYIVVTEGISLMTDMSGWAFFISSFYFVTLYWKSQQEKKLLIASFLVAIGGLFKEYGLLAYIGIFCTILFFHIRDPRAFFRKIVFTGLISFVPIVLVYTFVYTHFNYTYLNWLSHNVVHYGHPTNSLIIEYVKVYGSLYHFGWFLFVGGLWYLYKNYAVLDKEFACPLFLIFLSSGPLLFWPAITQRILFLTILPAIIVSAYFIKMTKRIWPVHAVILLIYVCVNIFMHTYILPNIHIDSLFQ